MKRIAILILACLAISGCLEPRTFKADLVSISNGTRVEGQFYFLGGGRIDEKEFIFAWGKDEGGEIYRLTIPVKVARIYMDTEENPYIRGQYAYGEEVHPSELMHSWVRAELHVPRNTIIEKYELK
jgi:hypothetical protein